MLSLDCFDTLIWRNVHKPADRSGSRFGRPSRQRVRTSAARTQASLAARRNEVTIEEIYTALLPSAKDEERQAYLARELEAEAQHCYAFEPTAALIREAKARAEVAVVSGTYLGGASRSYRGCGRPGASQSTMSSARRFTVRASASAVRTCAEGNRTEACGNLPIGDNRAADRGRRPLRIPALHLTQFDEDVQAQPRSRCCAILDGSGPHDRRASRHRAALAAALPQIDTRPNGSACRLGPCCMALPNGSRTKPWSAAKPPTAHTSCSCCAMVVCRTAYSTAADTACPSAAKSTASGHRRVADDGKRSARLYRARGSGMNFHTIAGSFC